MTSFSLLQVGINPLISGNLPSSPQQFVVCERRKFSQLAKLPSSCFKVVKSEEELHGYKVAVVQEWALSRARYIYYWQLQYDRGRGRCVCKIVPITWQVLKFRHYFACNVSTQSSSKTSAFTSIFAPKCSHRPSGPKSPDQWVSSVSFYIAGTRERCLLLPMPYSCCDPGTL